MFRKYMPLLFLGGVVQLTCGNGYAEKPREQSTTQSQPISIRVDTAAKGVTVSPHLYGVFFEEINHAGDGGLYAELVCNRSFEDGSTPEAWSAAESGGAKGILTLDSTQPLNAKNTRSLRLDVEAATGNSPFGVSNGGYWGIPVQKGERYSLSLYARSKEAGRQLTVRLESSDGKTVYGETKLSALTSEWKEYTGTLTARSDDPKARLTILTDTPGSVWLDVVSLFPGKTFKGRENGMRPDLAQMVANMRPAFFRFPGGCFVEGDTMASAYRWKDTIGDISERPGRACLWGYRSTEGLGYHEYLQLCEDLGSEPLLVVNCGMSHRQVVPMDQMEPWVQDALDAIEYATGPATSQWGALRAKHGHPKPFRLRYVEIGNENGGPAYNERYALIYDAIKKKHPEMQLIANVWGGVPSSRPSDLIDEHYYHDPNWFFSNADKYDSYKRNGPKIFVGEYAVTNGAGQGNLDAALGEAVFMMGMERNSDMVTLAAYAPLFVHVNDRKWNPDAIAFDGTRVYGTPSYHVQQVFAQYRPEVSLPTTVQIPEAGLKTIAKIPDARGAVGLGTWLTQAEYKDITIADASGNTLATGDKLPPRIFRGMWENSEGTFRQTDNGDDRRLVIGDTNWTDYTLSLKARKNGGEEGFLILFRVRDDQNLYWWNLGGWGNTRHAVERMVGGSKSIAGQEVQGRIETGRWYDIRIEVRGPKVSCYLDGKLLTTFEEKGVTRFQAVGGKSKEGYTLKAVNGSEAEQTAELELAGVSGNSKDPISAEAITLTGDALSAENSLDNPKRVAPVTTKVALPVVSRASGKVTLRYTFPPRSLTILRLPKQL